jgi:predicted membrane chloride channel (bestrophin family)
MEYNLILKSRLLVGIFLFLHYDSLYLKRLVHVFFRFHKSDTVRQLFPMIVAIALYSLFISILELKLSISVKNLSSKNLSLIYSMLGFVISLLLVFRTNTAYDRWWEGRRLWGQLINASRNLSIKLIRCTERYRSFRSTENADSLFAMSLNHT